MAIVKYTVSMIPPLFIHLISVIRINCLGKQWPFGWFQGSDFHCSRKNNQFLAMTGLAPIGLELYKLVQQYLINLVQHKHGKIAS